jgi:hypothetical protein
VCLLRNTRVLFIYWLGEYHVDIQWQERQVATIDLYSNDIQTSFVVVYLLRLPSICSQYNRCSHINEFSIDFCFLFLFSSFVNNDVKHEPSLKIIFIDIDVHSLALSVTMKIIVWIVTRHTCDDYQENRHNHVEMSWTRMRCRTCFYRLFHDQHEKETTHRWIEWILARMWSMHDITS